MARRLRWIFAGLAFALVCVSFPAAGAVTATASLEASAVQADVGLLGGEVAATRWTQDQPGPIPWMSLSAAHARVAIDVSTTDADVQTISLTPATESTEGPAAYTGLTLQAADVATPARVLALPADGSPLPTALQDGGGVRIVPGAGSDLTEFRLASAQAPDFRLPVAGAFEVIGLDGHGRLHLTGDVRLVVTGMVLDLVSDQGPVTIDTARRDEAAIAPQVGTAGPVRRVEFREAILELRGATLVLPASTAWFQEARLDAAALTLEDARGTLAWLGHEEPVDGQDVAASGTPRLALTRSPNGALAAQLDGSVSSLAIDGAAVAFGAPQRAPTATVGGWAFGTLVLVAGAGHVARGRLRFRAVDRALGDQRYAEALALAGRFRLHPWHRQDAALAAALSLTELDRAAEAREQLLSWGGWAPARRATRDFLLARAAARMGERHEAVRWLAASLLADPGLMAQAKADPVLAPVVGPWSDLDPDDPAPPSSSSPSASSASSASEAYA